MGELADLLKVPSVVKPVIDTCQTCGAAKPVKANLCQRCYVQGLAELVRSAWRS